MEDYKHPMTCIVICTRIKNVGVIFERPPEKANRVTFLPENAVGQEMWYLGTSASYS